MRDWIDAKGRLHRFLGVWDGRAHFKVEVPSTVVRAGFDPLSGGDSATYYSSTDDGWIMSGSTVSYGAARSGGTLYAASNESIDFLGQWIEGEWYYIARTTLFFDTSGLPDDVTVSAATLGLRGTFKGADRAFDVVVVAYTGSRPAGTGDWGEFGSTSYGSISSGDWVTNNYNSITLNATGRGAINLTGWTPLGIRVSREIDNDAPTEVDGNGERVSYNSADYTGTTRDPKLDITYSLPVVDVTITPPPGLLTIHSAAPIVGIATVVAAPPGYLSIWPSPAPETGTYVVVEAPSGLLALFTAPPGIIAGQGVTLSAPPAHLSLYPGWAVHEAPHLPGRVRVSRTRPSHWFTTRRDIVRK